MNLPNANKNIGRIVGLPESVVPEKATYTQQQQGISSSGYMSGLYAESLSEFGAPFELSSCKGYILEREIRGTALKDAMSCYPIFCCQDWSQLPNDVEALSEKLVSLTVVTDPFGAHDELQLRKCFSDLTIPFKNHYLVDLSKPKESYVSKHNKRYAKKSLRDVDVNVCGCPCTYLDDWNRLYSILVRRHSISGLPRFSAWSFEKQFGVPGLVAFRAAHGKRTVGMMLWFMQGRVAYYHLGAYDETGYALRASYALVSKAIDYFADLGLNWLSLGGGAGIRTDDDDGLSRFKRGWSNSQRVAYLCGRVLDATRYRHIVEQSGTAGTDYFPAYRAGEFS